MEKKLLTLQDETIQRLSLIKRNFGRTQSYWADLLLSNSIEIFFMLKEKKIKYKELQQIIERGIKSYEKSKPDKDILSLTNERFKTT